MTLTLAGHLTPVKYDWGFCFVKGIPVDPESTKTLIERIAFIRHTHYGMIYPLHIHSAHYW